MTSRRVLLTRGAALVALPFVARAASRLQPTPAQTEGPYYPTRLPADTDADLLVNGARRYAAGDAAWVAGTVRDTAGRPLAGAVVEIWQCDHDGHYHHPADGDRADPAFQGYGRATVGRDGGYRFHAMRPAPYAGRTPHIHFKVRVGTRELLTTQLYVAGDPGNARDFLWRSLGTGAARDALTRPFTAAPDGLLQAQFPIVVDA